MPDHKIVCWGDYAIPVPVEANWIAWDIDDEVRAFVDEPKRDYDYWITGNYMLCEWSVIPSYIHCPPPEPGPWTDQLYWIGD